MVSKFSAALYLERISHRQSAYFPDSRRSRRRVCCGFGLNAGLANSYGCEKFGKARRKY